jgi:hypothetical protein
MPFAKMWSRFAPFAWTSTSMAPPKDAFSVLRSTRGAIKKIEALVLTMQDSAEAIRVLLNGRP